MSPSYSTNDSDILYDTIDGEGFIINTKTGKYYLMNQTGTAIWSFIQKGCNVPQVIEAIATRFAMDFQSVRQQVEAFVGRLLDEKLLVRKEAAVAAGMPAGTALAMDSYLAPMLNTFADLVDDAFACS